ncbi:MAG: DUF3014 domain-containing protein [Candidatus Aminicenantes bacterium]|nr:DUF3014 domain-containing protein [Candidatus Aminicenantes bacterium]
MEDSKKVFFTGTLVIVVVAVVVVVYYFFIRENPEEVLPIQEVVQEEPVQVPEEEPVIEEEVPEPVHVELDKSDEFLRDLAKELSSHKRYAVWLKRKDLIRRFAAAVDNIANGMSPRPQIDFFMPKGDFKVVMKDDLYFVDPGGYSRYNLATNVFASLDSEGCAKLYWQMKPLVQEAYRDLGYPGKDFDITLRAAIVELLKVPIIKGEVQLEKKVISYAIVDPVLESLSEAQKHILRMGPNNVHKIQGKLRELGAALGIPGNKFPRSRSYSPKNRSF